MSILQTWPEEGGFCILTWVHESESGAQFFLRFVAFLAMVLPASIILNFSWLLWQAIRWAWSRIHG